MDRFGTNIDSNCLVWQPRRMRIQWSVATLPVLAMVLVMPAAHAAEPDYNEANLVGLTESADFTAGWRANYGSVGFEPDGDELWVLDNATDGKSVGMYWQTTSGRSGICRNAGGSRPDRWSKCNKNFPESAAIRIKIGKCSVSSSRNCKSPGNYTFTSGWSNYVSIAG